MVLNKKSIEKIVFSNRKAGKGIPLLHKSGAMELSIGTIVILVLAMTMLILGLVLVRTIFTGAKYNVDQMNDKVRDEIGALFVGDQKIVVYLANNQVEIKQGKDWGVAVMIKNTLRDTSQVPKFNYEVTMLENSCSLKSETAMSWVKLGKKSINPFNIAPGNSEGWVVRFSIPENAPLCLVRYNIDVKADGQPYDSANFDVSIV